MPPIAFPIICFILVILAAVITGFAAAGGLVFHRGAGYHSSYV